MVDGGLTATKIQLDLVFIGKLLVLGLPRLASDGRSTNGVGNTVVALDTVVVGVYCVTCVRGRSRSCRRRRQNWGPVITITSNTMTIGKDHWWIQVSM